MSKRIRLLAMINTLEIGGTEKRLVELACGLPRERFEVEVACMVGAGAYAERLREAGISVHLLGYRGVREEGRLRLGRLAGLPFVAGRVSRLLRSVRPDVFHTFLPNCNVFGAVAAARRRFRGLIASRVFTSDYRSANPLYPAIENWSARRACRIVCNCEAVRRDVLEREKVDLNRLRVIRNGVDTDLYAPGPEDTVLRRALGLPEEEPVVGIVANLLPHKRHEDFLAAAALVARRVPEAHFALVGRPCEREPALRAMAENLGLGQRVHFLGPRGDMASFYRLFKVQVSASTDEGLSNALIEGQACGVPAVATAVAGTPEIIVEGETGFLVRPMDPEQMADRVCRILMDESLHSRLSFSARQHKVEHFGLERMVAGYAALYEEVVQETGTGEPSPERECGC